MQESTLCFGKYDKPGKYEKISYMPTRATIKNCPDCDKKRTTVFCLIFLRFPGNKCK